MSRDLFRAALVAAVVGVAIPSAVRAQPPNASTKTIAGRVTDSAGLPVPGAIVALDNKGTGLQRVESTDGDGAFRFDNLGSGSYRVNVALQGFAPVSRDVEPGARADIALAPAQVIETVTVVSGARQAELRESLSTPVNVVGSSRLQDTARSSVGEVLREVPGVLTRRGSEGTAVAGEQIQGIDSRQVLVLVDGQPVAGARGIKSGAINLDRQTTYRLDRVEIVKGAASALFGSDAIGGVINLITRDATAPVETMATLSGGEHGTFDGAITAGGKRGVHSLFGTASRSERDSFDLTPTTPDTTGVQFTRHDGFIRFGTRPSSSFSITASSSGYWNNQRGRAIGEAGLADSVVDDESQAGSVRALWQAAGGTSIEARAYATRFNETNATTLIATLAAQPLDTLRESVVKGDVSFHHVLGERHLLQAGTEVAGNRYRGVNRVRDAGGHEATTAVAWAQDRFSLASWATLTIGGRYDHHSIFGGAFSPKAAINARVIPALDGFRVRASYGEGFRAPDLGQLFYRFVPSANFYQVIGNPDLNPEHAESYQAGADYSHRSGRFRIGANAFRNDVRDLIEAYSVGFIATPGQLAGVIAEWNLDPTFAPVLGRQLFFYRNVANARTKGFELDGEVALAGSFQVAGAYTYLDADDLTRPSELSGRHRHQGHTRVTWIRAPLGIRAEIRGTFYSSWLAVASRSATDPGVRAAAFALWDAYAAKKVVKGLELFVAIDNLTNNQDPNTGTLLASGAPAPIYRPDIGRTIRFGVRWTFEKR
jgi:outer membrane receptor for ferrienterochelin and colicins